jgi:ribosome maturation factor RimP
MVSTVGLPEAQCREIASLACGQVGVDLEDFSVTKTGRREVVRVIVDQDGGIDLDLIADISRRISEDFDSRFESLDFPYVLEVSSPGVDRPLTELRHWRRAVGHLVKIEFVDNNESQFYRVTGSDDGIISLTDSDGQALNVPMSQIDNAVVQIEFNRGE